MGQHYSLGYDGHDGRHSMLRLCLDIDGRLGQSVRRILFFRLTWLVSLYDSEAIFLFPNLLRLPDIHDLRHIFVIASSQFPSL